MIAWCESAAALTSLQQHPETCATDLRALAGVAEHVAGAAGRHLDGDLVVLQRPLPVQLPEALLRYELAEGVAFVF